MLEVTQRIAGDRLSHADDGYDVAGHGLGDFRALAGVSLGVIELADYLLTIGARIVRSAVGLQDAGVDAHKVQLPLDIGNDFEDQAAERLFGIGFTDLYFVFFLGMNAADRRAVKRTG